MTSQLNVRLPDVIIDEINALAEDYGSQAKVIITAVSKLRKEIEMSKLYKSTIEKMDAAKTEEERQAFAGRAIAALGALPEAEQEQIATQEFLRFKKFINDRLSSTSR